MSQSQDRIRRATQTLDTLNDLIKRDQFQLLTPVLESTSTLDELSQVYDKDGQSIFFKLIYMPSEHHAQEFMQRFISKGGNIKRKDNNKQSILFYASRFNKVALIRYLINLDFEVEENDYMMQTPLFYCSRFNKTTQIAKMLISAGCDPNHKDANGQTPLFYAASEGNLQMCRILVQNGANVLSTDKNKERPMHYAKRNNHREVYQFLSTSKNDYRKTKEIREDRRMQESSQNTNTIDRKRKKEGMKNEYSLVYVNEEGQVKVLSYQELMHFKDASEQNAKLVSLMIRPDEPVESLPSPSDRRFEKICSKILSSFMRHQNGAVFGEPVNYVALNILDYPLIVKYPMDFGTIKKKLSLNGYQNQLQFQGDMNLVFDNCILYNGTGRDIGKIALQMKTEFNAMFIKQFS